MIVNNAITYGNYPSLLDSWRPKGDTSFGLFTAVVTTVFSYQCSAALHDLFLGLKPQGKAKVSNLCLFLLTNSSSPSFTYHILRQRGDNDEDVNDDACQEKSKWKNFSKSATFTKLFVLLLLASVVNVISIVLTLEFDRYMTFSEADFKGVALGVNPDLSVIPSQAIPQGGSRLSPEHAVHDTPLVEFAFRTLRLRTARTEREANAGMLWQASGTGNGSAILELSLAYSAVLRVIIRSRHTLVNTGIMAVMFMHSTELDVTSTFYVLRHNMDQQGMQALSTFGGKLVSEWCGGDGGGTTVNIEPQPTEQLRVDHVIPCENEGRVDDLGIVAMKMLARVTLVNSARLEVKEYQDLTNVEGDRFFDAGDFLFLRRRRSRVSLLGLSMMAIAALAIRLVVAVVTRNDIATGLELMLKEAFRVSWCDSLLSRNIQVCYEPGAEYIEVYHENESPSKPHEKGGCTEQAEGDSRGQSEGSITEQSVC